ncbi:hypothetical protein [Actinacidiphila sp. ITFR-21]|uniref:hypothetical protein n=1 Tax=Actinacidiphila sp. ITFR-21 TaxID=3075199 RepID=UPI00288C602A|nr:hypothetical protein [Streptomyces sp. ITFR-21]WNI19190.1 hypothetical protein RLT57_29045 [Streptomyces sp. ITFR-21]
MYRYRCGLCETTSLPVRTWSEVLTERDQHRQRMHAGHIPDGEQLLRQHQPGRPTDTRATVWIILIAGTLLILLILRH